MKPLILAALLAATPALAALPLPPAPPHAPPQTLPQACGAKPHPAPSGLLAQACTALRQDAAVIKVLSERLTAAQNDAIGWQVRAIAKGSQSHASGR